MPCINRAPATAVAFAAVLCAAGTTSRTAWGLGPSPQAAQPVGKPLHRATAFVILIDPAHGGKDFGAAIGASAEKDITRQVAIRLRSALASRNIDARLTRDDDIALTATQRADRATSLAPAACITLHATGVGSGVHVFYPLQQFALVSHSFVDQWTSGSLPPSHQSAPLAKLAQTALKSSHIGATLEPAADPVLSHERCPAIAVEMAPLPQTGSPVLQPEDPGYQQLVTDAIVAALVSWRAQTKQLDDNAATYGRKLVR